MPPRMALREEGDRAPAGAGGAGRSFPKARIKRIRTPRGTCAAKVAEAEALPEVERRMGSRSRMSDGPFLRLKELPWSSRRPPLYATIGWLAGPANPSPHSNDPPYSIATG